MSEDPATLLRAQTSFTWGSTATGLFRLGQAGDEHARLCCEILGGVFSLFARHKPGDIDVLRVVAGTLEWSLSAREGRTHE